MAGIYIPNLEIPTDGYVTITVRSDSIVVLNASKEDGKYFRHNNSHIGKAIPVPDHGRLIDAAYIEAENDRRFDFACATEEIAEHEYAYAYHVVASILATAPTIIEADKGGDV